jgi:hypothetical protein
MATIKINSRNKRVLNVDVTWSDGLVKSGLIIPDCPVEDFASTQSYMFSYITGIYQQERALADAAIKANPTPDPMVTAAIGHTFDDLGNIIA